MTEDQRRLLDITRRHFFRQAGFGIGSAALTSLFNRSLLAQADDQSAWPSSRRISPAKAKNVIYLFMAGGALAARSVRLQAGARSKFDGQPCPEDLIKGERFAFIKGIPKLLGSPYRFAKYGQSGASFRSCCRTLAKIVDDVAIVRSLHTTQFNHAPAQIFMNTGYQIPGRPSMGAWLTYGIGSENAGSARLRRACCPAQNQPDGGSSCWGSGFLPTVYQGVRVPAQAGDPVLFLSNPEGVTAGDAPALARRAARSQLVRIRPTSAIRKSPRASPLTRWRTRCKPACRS